MEEALLQLSTSGSQQLSDIQKGLVCPYCGQPTEYVDSTEVYSKNYGKIYLCRRCEAWVGVHEGTNKALGRLANERLRYWKKQAHYFFDKIARTSFINEVWKEEIDESDRNKAYLWLSKQMGIERHLCHIGMFDVEECRKVIEICTPYLETLQINGAVAKEIEGQKASEVTWEKADNVTYDYRKMNKRESAFNTIKEFATEKDILIKVLQPGQIRLTKAHLRLDIYTTNQKWHDLTNSKRGEYKELIQFLEKTF